MSHAAVLLSALQPSAHGDGGGPGSAGATIHDIGRITEAARRHRVPGYVLRMVRQERAFGAEDIAPLRMASLAAAAMHMRTVHELRCIGAAFDADGIHFAVLKGPVLAARYHVQPQLRAYADLDLLVSGTDLCASIRALEALGATIHPAAWHHALHDGWGEIPMTMPSGLPIDLHWHLLNRQSHRAHFDVDMDAVLGRTRLVELDGARVPTLDPVDTLAHLCLHATTSGGNRLVWLKDVERVIHHEAIPWEGFMTRVEGWGTALPAAVILDRARDLISADVPDAVIRRLAVSRSWLSLGRTVRHLNPPARWRGRASPDRMVTRATRADGPTSRRELLTRSLHALAPERLRRSDREDGSFGHGIDASSDREHYLAAVERASGARAGTGPRA